MIWIMDSVFSMRGMFSPRETRNIAIYRDVVKYRDLISSKIVNSRDLSPFRTFFLKYTKAKNIVSLF